MLSVILPDGSRKQFDRPVSAYDVAAEIGPGLAKAAILAEVDGRQVDLHSLLPTIGRSPAAAAHQEGCRGAGRDAALRGARDGPGRDAALRGRATGVRADDRRRASTTTSSCRSRSPRRTFRRSRPRWPKIVKADEPFERVEVPRDEALQLCQDLGQAFKVEHIETGWRTKRRLSFYRQGEFIDLCRGPHVPSAGAHRQAFKLLSVAGAYWKGDASRQQLQRLYGTAFFDKKSSTTICTQLEEAKRRDHRVLGKQLELFTISQTVGSGLILWLPKGAIIRQTLEDLSQRRAAPPRLSAGLHAEHRQRRAVRDLGPLSVLQRQPVPADRDGGRRAVPAQADELPAPHHDLQVEAAQLPRPAGAAGGVRHRVSLRAVGRAERA